MWRLRRWWPALFVRLGSWLLLETKGITEIDRIVIDIGIQIDSSLETNRTLRSESLECRVVIAGAIEVEARATISLLALSLAGDYEFGCCLAFSSPIWSRSFFIKRLTTTN